ncbi:MAG: hypothetical protein JXR03_12610 [Cyclobacteriaceae bacterium]
MDKQGYLIWLWLVLAALIGCQKKEVLVTDGAISINPVLSWPSVGADSTEVWIDGIKMDVVLGVDTVYFPFPMAFGKHEWYVKQYIDGGELFGEKSTVLIEDKPLDRLPEGAILLRYNWRVRSAHNLSSVESIVRDSSKNWFPATMPSTVLTTLVRNGQYPNPYVAQNNLKIPDANDTFNAENDLLKFSHIPGVNPFSKPYWFRTSFELPKNKTEKTVWLHFNEINYAAEIWLNGELVADSSIVKGMERRFKFDVSSTIKNTNELLVKIYPLDHPGKPAPPATTALQHPGRNMGEDPSIAKNYTKWDALGWDWQPAIRDREMGITEDVFVSFTGSLDLIDPYITADLPLPDTTSADVKLSIDIHNTSEEVSEGKLVFEILDPSGKEIIDFDYEVQLLPGITNTTISKQQIADLKISNPKLWWPINYGNPNLYTVNIKIFHNGTMSDSETIDFGIREVETYIGNYERVYKINGQKIYPRGGNWVNDMLLSWTKTRYDQEINLSAQANLNLQRIWGPTGVPPACFFDAADRNGIMIWQDFLSDFWGTKELDPLYRPEEGLYKLATIDIIKKLRNHPSLIIWCGGNEGPNPREEIIVNELLPKYDPDGSRHYLKNSLGDGLHGTGPYHNIRPAAYFRHFRVTGFSSELGPSGFPTEESIRRFLPDLGKKWKHGFFPISDDWAYHDANDREHWDSRKFTSYDSLVRYDYNFSENIEAEGVSEYAGKAQMVNYETYRSVIEAVNHQLWEGSSGYAIWKYNSSWPSLVWQLYDWYLIPNAGFYAARNANLPQHIQLNRDNHQISLINTTFSSISGELSVSVLDTAFNEVRSNAESVMLNANTVLNTSWSVSIPDSLNLYFVNIEFKSENKVIDRNFYWINLMDDYSSLDNLEMASLTPINLKVKGKTLSFDLKNNSKKLAFFNRCRLVHKSKGTELLPSYWSDNYISLLPGESRHLEVKVDLKDLDSNVLLEIRGHNVNTTKASLY